MDVVHLRKQSLPHKRSKKGCLQCRKRRKKCPEDYQQWSNGCWSCSACKARGQNCKLPTKRQTVDNAQQINTATTPNRSSESSEISRSTPNNTTISNNATPTVEHSWLDTFLEEFMALTEPSLQNITQTPFTSSVTPTSTFDLLPFSVSPQETNRSESVIDRMIGSDDLDDLLIKSAHIYDTFLCAIFDTSKVAGNATLIDHLMEITRSNNICKASLVSCCLAYTDVIERERKNTRGPSRFVQYLLKGTKKANPTNSTIPSRQVHQWLKYATDGFHKIKSTMNLSAKLLTLLNLRFACICFLGAKEAYGLANEIHSVLFELGVDIHYLRSTARKGTPLSLIIQALAYANIMDAASMKGVRPAIVNETVNIASSLQSDLVINPKADLKMVTLLSVDLIECIKRISDLSTDIFEGQLLDTEAKSEEIKKFIVQSQVDLPNDICQTNARVRSFLLQELWKQALLIQLYQDVLKLGPMAVRVQEALKSIIRLAELLQKTEEEEGSPTTYIDVWDMSFVWFLACTVSISQKQRKFCLDQFENLGCERAILDNIEAIKILWKSMDETGRSTEWRDVLNEHGIVINFTF